MKILRNFGRVSYGRVSDDSSNCEDIYPEIVKKCIYIIQV